MKFRAELALVFLFWLACCVVASGADSPDTSLRPTNQIEIYRNLVFEYAVLRQPLPASQKIEEALQVNSTGQINEDKLRQDLANRGVAVEAGEVIQITAIDFERKHVLFEVNGGGKKKKKWWQRIRVQAGVSGTGIPPPQPPTDRDRRAPSPTEGAPVMKGRGSWVTVNFPGSVPDMTPSDMKQLLAGVFDFSQRSAAVPWIETIPEEYREAIQEKKAVVGMTREMVLAAMGQPNRKVREIQDGREIEDWIYGDPPFVTFVRFIGDEVVEVKEFR